jgi:hypothetical protein
VLRVIDLSSVGGLNFNGIETLQMVEELEPYQWGILPSQSNIQKSSHELDELISQHHLPSCRKQSNLGEVYQFDFYLSMIWHNGNRLNSILHGTGHNFAMAYAI